MSVDATAQFDAWVARAKAIDIISTARALGAVPPKYKSNQGVPCPFCGGHDRFSVYGRKQIMNCRRCEAGRGDVIKLVEGLKGLSFVEACEWLVGEPPPGKSASDKVKQAGTVELAHAQSEEARAAEENEYRGKEMDKARAIWERGAPIQGTQAEEYLAARGITL